jgi:hypothetical protein
VPIMITLERLLAIFSNDPDPLLEVIGIAEDGHLTEAIDDELYGQEPL